MLRSSTATLGALRRPLPQLFIRPQSTATTQVQAAPAQGQQQQQQQQLKAPLSARLRGAGRGVPELQVSDPLQKFVKGAESRKLPTGSSKQKFAPGQFDDAPGDAAAAASAPRSQRNNNNNNNKRFQPRQRQQQQRARQQQQQKAAQGGNNNRTPRERQQQRRSSLQSSNRAANQPVRRVTTFIDQDIDWNLMSSLEETTAVAASSPSEPVPEVQSGEYQRYFDVSKDLQWAPVVNAESLSVLVGSNASYNMEQKIAFMNAVSSATKGAAAATATK